MKKIQGYNFLPFLLITVLVLAFFFMPLPQRKIKNEVCTLSYPTQCPMEYYWTIGPSLFQKLASEKSNPDTGTLETGAEDAQFCGGIAANSPENKCPKGYKCKLDGKYPDASGICVKE